MFELNVRKPLRFLTIKYYYKICFTIYVGFLNEQDNGKDTVVLKKIDQTLVNPTFLIPWFK